MAKIWGHDAKENIPATEKLLHESIYMKYLRVKFTESEFNGGGWGWGKGEMGLTNQWISGKQGK